MRSRDSKTIKNIVRPWTLLLVLAAGLSSSFSAQTADIRVSGVIDYRFDPNPQEITPKLHNWEIKWDAIDSRTGSYEIVQVTRRVSAEPKARDVTSSVLIDDRMMVSNPDGIIDFKLYVGEKQPKLNMPGPGSMGEPIIFSGRGTGKGASNWIILQGSKVDRVIPSGTGTRMSDGRLNLIQFITSNAGGETFQTDVVLGRK